jgi:hypothetical protein
MAVAPVPPKTSAAARPRLDGGEHGVTLARQSDDPIAHNQSI